MTPAGLGCGVARLVHGHPHIAVEMAVSETAGCLPTQRGGQAPGSPAKQTLGSRLSPSESGLRFGVTAFLKCHRTACAAARLPTVPRSASKHSG